MGDLASCSPRRPSPGSGPGRWPGVSWPKRCRDPRSTASRPRYAKRSSAADQAARDAPSAASVGALGTAYHGAQRPADALAAYALAARLDRADPRWIYLASLLLEDRGDADGAGGGFQQVVAATPSHGLAWFRLGELAFKRGALDEAQTAYARARDAPVEPPFLPSGVTSRAAAAAHDLRPPRPRARRARPRPAR